MKINTKKLLRLMKLNCFNNATLAEAMGVNAKTVSALRNNKVEPQAATMRKLCGALKCEPRDLLDD